MTRIETNRPDKATARIVGALFLIATSAYIVGGGLVDPILSGPDVLSDLRDHRPRAVFGVLLQFVTAAANVLIGVLLFSILKRYSQTIALGYFATRMFDGIGVLIAGVGSLSLVALSHRAVQAGADDAAGLRAVSALVVSHSETTFDVTMLALAVGAIPFCYLLYRTRLIPRPLAALGFAGYVALLGGGVAELFGADLSMMHYVPGGAFEAVLPLWLFFRGFGEPAPTPGLTPATRNGRGGTRTAA